METLSLLKARDFARSINYKHTPADAVEDQYHKFHITIKTPAVITGEASGPHVNMRFAGFTTVVSPYSHQPTLFYKEDILIGAFASIMLLEMHEVGEYLMFERNGEVHVPFWPHRNQSFNDATTCTRSDGEHIQSTLETLLTNNNPRVMLTQFCYESVPFPVDHMLSDCTYEKRPVGCIKELQEVWGRLDK